MCLIRAPRMISSRSQGPRSFSPTPDAKAAAGRRRWWPMAWSTRRRGIPTAEVRSRRVKRRARGSYTSTGEPAFSATAGYFLQSGTLNALTGSNNTVLWSFTGDGDAHDLTHRREPGRDRWIVQRECVCAGRDHRPTVVDGQCGRSASVGTTTRYSRQATACSSYLRGIRSWHIRFPRIHEGDREARWRAELVAAHR